MWKFLRRLSDRYETSESVEMMIQRFETMRQLDGESLESYMVRVRRAGSYAFPKENENSVRSRVLWKFLSGLKNDITRKGDH